MNTGILSKSRVMEGMQCPRRLWLSMNAPGEGAVDEGSLQLLQGQVAGEVARRRWPGGELIGPARLAEAAELTREVLARTPSRPVFEGAFVYQGVGVRADVIVPTGDGEWDLVEVKSSTSQKPEHVDDCAIQAWVIENAGLRLRSISLALIDNTFVYPGGDDYRGLFQFHDVTGQVRKRLPGVPAIAAELAGVAGGDEPGTEMGSHCKKPWPCPFQAHCAGEDTGFPLSTLPGQTGKKLARELAAEGFSDLSEVPPSRMDKPRYRRIIEAIQAGGPVLSDEAGALIPRDTWPRFHLDFETAAFAVPVWPGTRPYQKIPFQFSCHVEQRLGKSKHETFLSIGADDSSEACAARLVEVLGEKGPIFTYGHFERGIVNGLAKHVPAFADRMSALAERMVDVLPIVREYYYHPDMMGSSSIKDVAPTVSTDLGYDSLDGVAEGNAAQLACWRIATGEVDAEESRRLQAALDKYCAQDTNALMKVVHFLEGRSWDIGNDSA